MQGKLADIPTPIAIVDLERARRNALALATRLGKLGTSLRLHVKTCKSVDLASLSTGGEPGPIAVATLEEAEYFAYMGFTDMIYAVGITPAKLQGICSLVERGINIRVILDSMELARFVAERPEPLDVILEIDCDGHRCGIAPESAGLLKIADILARSGKRVCGVLSHAGSAYELPMPAPAAFRELSRRENRAILKAAARLRAAGHDIAITSAGSTPTAVFGTDFEGITEVRAGTHIFMDCIMAALGVCTEEEFALSVLATVIGIRADGNPVIDAGWTALSLDRGVNFEKYGYGLVADADGTLYPDLKVIELNQEHGVIGTSGEYLPRFTPGVQVRVFPVHACAMANAFGKYHVLDGDGVVVRRKCPQR